MPLGLFGETTITLSSMAMHCLDPKQLEYMRLTAHTHHLISHITTRPTLTDGTARSHRCNDAQIISQQHKHNALRGYAGAARYDKDLRTELHTTL